MKTIIVLVLQLCSLVGLAQTGSEILLFDLSIKRDKLVLSNPKNITHHVGYDNQPSFHADQPLIFYSSFNPDGRSDIKSYDYEKGETKSLTQTTEREYSPTLTPDKQFVSCIIQRDDGAQNLGKYPVGGGQPTILIDNLIVGYHAWVDQDRLLLFVLGEPQTLHLYNVKAKEDKVLAEKIGRSLHKIPGQNAMSFVHKISDSEWIIKRLDGATSEITTLVKTLPGREDLCWTPQGRIIMSDGTIIYSIDPKKEQEWSRVEFVGALQGVTRLAISNKGDKLALVVTE